MLRDLGSRRRPSPERDKYSARQSLPSSQTGLKGHFRPHVVGPDVSPPYHGDPNGRDLAGAAGGNIAGVLNKAKNLGPLINTVLGVVGGVGGGQLLGGMTGGSTAGTVGVSAVVGALLPLVAGLLKKQTV